MPKLTEAKLRAWHRRAEALSVQAGRLMDSMIETLGPEGENTDPMDNVMASIEDLCHVLSQPGLEMWGIPPKPRRKPPKKAAAAAA